MGCAYARNAVVTGAAQGIGRELCMALTREGWKVGIADIDLEAAEETRAMVEEAGGRGEVFRCDVGDPAQVAACADHFFSAWGEVGLLVNNAGIMVAGCTEDVPVEDWKKIVDVNFLGAVYGCRAFIPGMKKQGYGHILNMASMAGIIPLPEQAPYNSTKSAVIGFSETLRSELSPYGIGVTVVCPLCVGTHLLDKACVRSDFIADFYGITFVEARMSAEEIAGRMLRAVEKNRMYEMSQPFAKVLWASKRLVPRLLLGLFYHLNRLGGGKPFFLWLARRGIV